jgi:hypothetical protein
MQSWTRWAVLGTSAAFGACGGADADADVDGSAD